MEALKLKALYTEIARLTDINHHTESVIKLAEFLGQTKSVAILTRIVDIHLIEGSMPHALITYRNEIFYSLRNVFEAKYGIDEAMELNKCF